MSTPYIMAFLAKLYASDESALMLSYLTVIRYSIISRTAPSPPLRWLIYVTISYISSQASRGQAKIPPFFFICFIVKKSFISSPMYPHSSSPISFSKG